jgi:pimeloyl-ACP methyl ester carboxylesterase
VAVLRLDIAGIGDSPPAPGRPESVVYPPDALRDVSAAVSFVRQELGVPQVHLLGLCSGAYHAFKAAAAGLPIASAVIVNPLTFCWKEGMVLNDADTLQMTARYRRALWQGHTWRRLIGCRLNVRTIARATAQRGWSRLRHAGLELARSLHIELDDDLAAELHAAARRGVRLAFVFAQDDPGLRLLREQGGRAVQRLVAAGCITIDRIADADHTFTRAEARDRLVAVLDRLMFAQQEAAQPVAARPELRRAPRAA